MSTTHEVQKSKVEFTPEELIDEFQAGIWRYLRALGCSPAEADDFTQETFLAVLQKPFEQYSPASTGAYLRKVAYNRFITNRRRSNRMVLTEKPIEIEQDWIRLASDDHGESMLSALRECMSHLTKRAKLAIELRFRDKLSRTEIAAALSITEHGAKNLMQRAKKQLRACVEEKMT